MKKLSKEDLKGAKIYEGVRIYYTRENEHEQEETVYVDFIKDDNLENKIETYKIERNIDNELKRENVELYKVKIGQFKNLEDLSRIRDLWYKKEKHRGYDETATLKEIEKIANTENMIIAVQGYGEVELN